MLSHAADISEAAAETMLPLPPSIDRGVGTPKSGAQGSFLNGSTELWKLEVVAGDGQVPAADEGE